MHVNVIYALSAWRLNTELLQVVLHPCDGLEQCHSCINKIFC